MTSRTTDLPRHEIKLRNSFIVGVTGARRRSTRKSTIWREFKGIRVRDYPHERFAPLEFLQVHPPRSTRGLLLLYT